MKRILSVFLLICLMTSSVYAKDIIFFENKTEAYVDGNYLELLENEGVTPIVKDGIFYVPIRAFVELNNGSIIWKSTGGVVNAEMLLGSYYAIKSDSNEIIFYDGSVEKLNNKVFLNENYNRLMVPAEIFEKMGYSIAQINDALGVRIEGKYKTEKSIDTNDAISNVKINYSFATEEGDFVLKTVSDENTLVSKTAGKIGSVIAVTVTDGVPLHGDLSLTYNPELLGDVKEENLKLARYNEYEDKIELLNGVKIDASANILSAPIASSGEYVLVNGVQWVDTWAKQQLLIREDGEGRLFNVAFVLDISGSMSNSIRLLKEATLSFISELHPEDYVSVTTFETSAQTVLSGTFVKNITEDDKKKIQAIDDRGGTNMFEGLDKADDNRTPPYGTYLGDYEELLIVLSDGATDYKDKVLKKAKEYGKSNTRIISLALGNSSDVSLMEALAKETNGIYQYVDSAEDLNAVFEMIRGASIGLDTDTDVDGIPDLIETSGMRDQYGEIHTTNPNEADTDGDGYSDGEEMGALIDEDVAYFKRKSDPGLPSNFRNDAFVSLDDNKLFVNPDSKEYGNLIINLTLDYIRFKNYFIGEDIYKEPSGVRVQVIHEDCLEMVGSSSSTNADETISEISINNVTPGTVATGNSEKIKIYMKCKKLHEKDHDVKLVISGDNFGSFEKHVFLNFGDVKEFFEAQIATQYAKLEDAIKKETESKISKEMKGQNLVVEDQKSKIDSIYKKYYSEPTNNDLSEDELFAVKQAVLNFSDDVDIDLTIMKDDSEESIIQRLQRWVLNKDKRKYTIKVSNVNYEVEVEYNILGPQVKIDGKNVSCLINSETALSELENLQEDLDALYKEAVKDAGKELIFLSVDTILTDEVMDVIDNKVLEEVEKIIPDSAEYFKFYKTIYDSIIYDSIENPNYKEMKEHCDDILNKDYAPDTKEIAKEIIDWIEKISD